MEKHFTINFYIHLVTKVLQWMGFLLCPSIESFYRWRENFPPTLDFIHVLVSAHVADLYHCVETKGVVKDLLFFGSMKHDNKDHD